MALLPPPEGLTAPTLNDLILRIQQHSGPEGYAVAIARSNPDKYGVTRKAWIKCDRGGFRRAKGQKRIATSRLNKCPFMLRASRVLNAGIWRLDTVENSTHNHWATGVVAHPALRAIEMTPELIDKIARATQTQATPAYIINSLLDDDDENPKVTAKDIYNAKAIVRRRALGPLTPTQALLKWLTNDPDWWVQHQKDAQDYITHMFFSRLSSQKMLELNWEVIIMDSTYKTNK